MKSLPTLGIGLLLCAGLSPAQGLAPTAGAELELRRVLAQSPRELSEWQSESAPPAQLDSGGGAPRRWWPVLLSALVPGLGETVTGHYFRGAPLLAADIGLVGGAISQNSKGDERTEDFERFADEHYSEQLWSEHLAGTYGNFVNEFFDVGTTPSSVPLYVPKSIDEREWYENIGKWEVFYFGWEEYDPDGQGYWPSPTNPVFSVPSREKYVDLRGEANDAYELRDTLLSVSLLLRVFSLMQTAYLEGFIGGRFGAPQADGALLLPLGESLHGFAQTTLRGDSFVGLGAQF